MALSKDLEKAVNDIFTTKWKSRQGVVVPEATSIRLGNDAVELDAAVLYADLADSTGLVDHYRAWFAAEVYKTFLVVSCAIIRDQGGTITSFDGDRVMGVFIGSSKNSNAAKAALKINWAVQRIINPSIKKAFPNVSYSVSHAVGVDSGPLFVARTGIHGDNDLAWVGKPANYAAKMCALREGSYTSFISEEVFTHLNAEAKTGGKQKQAMWERTNWPEHGLTLYRSHWMWEP